LSLTDNYQDGAAVTRGLNKVLLIGRLDGPVEGRHTPNGRPVATFTLAVPRTWISAEGEHLEEMEWFNVVAWSALAQLCQETLSESDQVYVEGRLQTRSWEDSAGRKHFRTEVVAQEIIVITA
jgi:single-strand DNA-binding protein